MMRDLANRAGGEAPKPEHPNTQFLDDIRLTAGNEQLLAIYNRRDELPGLIDTWTAQAEQIEQRWPAWLTLKRLVQHATGIQDVEAIMAQIKTIEEQRQLLQEPDLIAPLLSNISQLLREALNRQQQQFDLRHQEGMERLEQDDNWQQLEPEQRCELLSEQRLTLSDKPQINLASTEAILSSLDKVSLTMLGDRIAALPTRFDNVATGAAELMEPQAQFIQVPRRTLKTEAEIDSWVEDVKQQLKEALQDGPIIIR